MNIYERPTCALNQGCLRVRIEMVSPTYRNVFHVTFRNSTPIPPAGFSLSEDLGTTPGFILTQYGPDLRVLRSCYEGLKSP